MTLAVGSQVICFGDSLTWGWGAGSSNYGAEGVTTLVGTEGASYPRILGGISGWAVSNYGIAGDEACMPSTADPQNGTDRLQDLIPTLAAPATIVVWIGVNDLSTKTPSQLVGAYERMITDAQAASANLFLCTLPPCAFGSTETRETTRQLINNWIRGDRGQTGSIDIEKTVKSSTSYRVMDPKYVADGRTVYPIAGHPHMSCEGYAAVARSVYGGVTTPQLNLPPVTY